MAEGQPLLRSLLSGLVGNMIDIGLLGGINRLANSTSRGHLAWLGYWWAGLGVISCSLSRRREDRNGVVAVVQVRGRSAAIPEFTEDNVG